MQFFPYLILKLHIREIFSRLMALISAFTKQSNEREEMQDYYRGYNLEEILISLSTKFWEHKQIAGYLTWLGQVKRVCCFLAEVVGSALPQQQHTECGSSACIPCQAFPGAGSTGVTVQCTPHRTQYWELAACNTQKTPTFLTLCIGSRLFSLRRIWD